jgi:hypothetical protein
LPLVISISKTLDLQKKKAANGMLLAAFKFAFGGGVTTPDKSTYLNALAAVKSAAETCGVCNIKVGMVAKNQCPCLL